MVFVVHPFQIYDIQLSQEDDHTWIAQTRSERDPIQYFNPENYTIVNYLDVYQMANVLRQQKCWIDGRIWATTSLPISVPNKQEVT